MKYEPSTFSTVILYIRTDAGKKWVPLQRREIVSLTIYRNIMQLLQ